jgi:septal ring factor EnvC (AmiA/AmiB activator)
MADSTMTVAQAARDLGLSERTVRRHCQSGRLRAQKVNVSDGLPEWIIEAESVRRLAELTEVMAGLVTGQADMMKALPAAREELAEVRAEAARIAVERDEAQGRAEGLVAEIAGLAQDLAEARAEATRTAQERDEAQRRAEALEDESQKLAAARERSWWHRVFGSKGHSTGGGGNG